VDPVFDRFARSMSKVPYYPDSTQASGAKLDKLLVNCRNRALTTIQPYLPSLPNYKLLTGWISDGHLNATAGIQEGSDCIAITLGTVHILRDLFLAMLSHPSLLTNIGSARLEKQRGQSVPNIKFQMPNYLILLAIISRRVTNLDCNMHHAYFRVRSILYFSTSLDICSTVTLIGNAGR
jgi:hypothetical protein